MYSLSDSVNVWIYRHFPALPAVAELILLIFPIFKKIEKNNESYNRLLPARVRAGIEKAKIAKIKQFCGFGGIVEQLIHIIINTDGYIACGSIAIDEVYANAPPTAPPQKQKYAIFQVFEMLQALLPPVLDELSETENQLKKQEIRNYATEKLAAKVAANQRSYPLDFSNLKNFALFEKNIKFCIIKQILPTLAIASHKANKKAENILKDAVAAGRRTDVALDAPLPSDDGKVTTYHDIIGSDDGNPLLILLALERKKAEEAALAALTAEQKARLIEQFDACRRAETKELFEVAECGDCETLPLPENTNKYRRKPKPQAAIQPLLFMGGGVL